MALSFFFVQSDAAAPETPVLPPCLQRGWSQFERGMDVAKINHGFIMFYSWVSFRWYQEWLCLSGSQRFSSLSHHVHHEMAMFKFIHAPAIRQSRRRRSGLAKVGFDVRCCEHLYWNNMRVYVYIYIYIYIIFVYIYIYIIYIHNICIYIYTHYTSIYIHIIYIYIIFVCIYIYIYIIHIYIYT